MKVFLVVFMLALFMREIYRIFAANERGTTGQIIWHSLWAIGLAFMAKYMGILFDAYFR